MTHAGWHAPGQPPALGVVIPCWRQERWLPRTVAAIESGLEGREWRGVLVRSGPSEAPLPPLSSRWQVIAPPVPGPLTPGAARMLGFSACGGEWVLFPDADVEIERAWLDAALERAARPGRLAGVWGRIEEWFEDQGEVRAGSPDLYKVGGEERAVPYLATLALYRREALLEAGGYDPRLSSEEDFELGLRLQALGWEMCSLGLLAAKHWSAPRPSLGELGRRWATGLCFGQGQVLRIYLGRPGFAALLRRQALNLATLLMWVAGLAALAVSIGAGRADALLAWLTLPVLVLLVMTVRKKSARLGLHALLSWTLNGLGLLVGLLAGPRGERTPREAGC